MRWGKEATSPLATTWGLASKAKDPLLVPWAPPRPPPAATVMSGSLEVEASSSSSYAQVTARGASKSQDQGKRAVEHDRSCDNKVCTNIAKVQWGLYVYVANLVGDILERKSISIISRMF